MIACARFNNLVYARTLKAGSEFFYKNFIQTAGWRPMTFDQIDWNYHTVFSYVMNPVQRRHKGISEVIIQTKTVDLLLAGKGNIRNLFKLIPFLDSHSASLHDIYGTRVNDINWLLMTNDHQVAIQETNRFLAEHHAPPINWNVNYTHATGSYMSEIYTRVKAHWEQENEIQRDSSVATYFDKDIELYNKIKAEYHARNNSSQHS